MPSCHATRVKHEGWDTARLPKPRQGKSRGRGRVRTTDVPHCRSYRPTAVLCIAQVSNAWRKALGNIRMKFTVQVTDPEEQNSPPMSPMLKRILSSRVVYAVSLPPPRRKNGIWKVHTWMLLGLIITGFLLLWLSFTTHLGPIGERFLPVKASLPTSSIITPYKDTNALDIRKPHVSDNLYGVVFDAGSTGTRVHVFELSRENPNEAYTLTDELFEQVNPGLSAYADSPERAGASLDPLLRAAEARVPRGWCSNTSVVLRATAGLRLLPLDKADSILNAVRQKLSGSCLVKTPNSVSILDGHQEGLYLWISLNFMANRLPSPIGPGITVSETALDRTFGTLDLGGGSTQITFAPVSLDVLLRAPPGFATAIDSGEVVLSKDQILRGKHVYSKSYLGLGLMSARFSVLHTISKRLPALLAVTQELYTPCFPPSASVDWSHAGRSWKVRHLPWNQSESLLLQQELKDATASLELSSVPPVLTSCYAFARSVLRDPVDENGQHAPLTDERLEATEFYRFVTLLPPSTHRMHSLYIAPRALLIESSTPFRIFLISPCTSVSFTIIQAVR
ncbi:Ectonucleoside triphosphate diphosphohydrolase 6, variant 2 [Clonorchis sinensis]|uniref:Ectonucleoside triphosphate diphosphohydrolase 6, variant 2 n=1 Tax=Clonorchis sinensis TaxID=79923 RepID=A0A8T1MVZ4_CLOSI|nr:Ectonucleoside triphosphate diphosphohydrolase 6, variant 2 [Clonorchis sinensis]